jgi:hypothetical protein
MCIHNLPIYVREEKGGRGYWKDGRKAGRQAGRKTGRKVIGRKEGRLLEEGRKVDTCVCVCVHAQDKAR